MKKNSAQPALSVPALRDRGHQYLQDGRFKDAAEVFKLLVRQEPLQPDWKRLLDQAYVGRACGLAAKGLLKEALIVLENTTDAAGVVAEPALYLGCLIRQGQLRKAALVCRKVLDHPRPGVVATPAFGEAAAVLGLVAPAPAPAGTVATPSAPALAPAERALGAWCDGADVDTVDQALPGISLRSPARPLRVILKGLILSGPEIGRRDGLLESVPESSVFAGLRQAAAVACLERSDQVMAAWGTLSTGQRAFVAEARGVPVAMVKLALDLEDAQRRGPEALLALLLREAAHLPQAELRAACIDLLPAVPRHHLRQVEARCGPLSKAERARVHAVHAEAEQEWEAACGHWENVIKALKDEGTEDARLGAAIICRHLADGPGTGSGKRCACPACQAQELGYLEQIVELDPQDIDSLLLLLRRHYEAEQFTPWNRWVQVALERFPRHGAVLEAAVESAARRNAYKKAAGYARTLLEIDPINQRARWRMIELRIAHARKKMREGRADLAAKELAEAGEWERADRPDPGLAINRALVGLRLTPGAGAIAGLEAAALAAGQASGGVVSGWLRVMLEARLLDYSDRDCAPAPRELKAATKQRDPAPADIQTALSLLAQPEVRDYGLLAAEGMGWVRPWLLRGADHGWSLEEFETLAQTLETLEEFDVLAAYAKRAAQREPGQPVYRYHVILARTRGDYSLVKESERTELKRLRDQVNLREDFRLAQRIDALIGPEGLMGRLRSAFEEDEPWDEVEEDDEDTDTVGGLALGASILEDLGVAPAAIVTLAETIGIDNAVDAVMKQIKGEKRKGRSLPVPFPVIELVVRTFLIGTLESRDRPGVGAPAKAKEEAEFTPGGKPSGKPGGRRRGTS